MTIEEIQAKLTQCVDSSKAFPLASLMGIATWSESWAKEEHAMPPSEWLAMTRITLAKLKPTNLKKFDEMIHALLSFSAGVYLLSRGGYTLKIETPVKEIKTVGPLGGELKTRGIVPEASDEQA